MARYEVWPECGTRDMDSREVEAASPSDAAIQYAKDKDRRGDFDYAHGLGGVLMVVLAGAEDSCQPSCYEISAESHPVYSAYPAAPIGD